MLMACGGRHVWLWAVATLLTQRATLYEPPLGLSGSVSDRGVTPKKVEMLPGWGELPQQTDGERYRLKPPIPAPRLPSPPLSAAATRQRGWASRAVSATHDGP